MVVPFIIGGAIIAAFVGGCDSNNDKQPYRPEYDTGSNDNIVGTDTDAINEPDSTDEDISSHDAVIETDEPDTFGEVQEYEIQNVDTFVETQETEIQEADILNETQETEEKDFLPKTGYSCEITTTDNWNLKYRATITAKTNFAKTSSGWKGSMKLLAPDGTSNTLQNIYQTKPASDWPTAVSAPPGFAMDQTAQYNITYKKNNLTINNKDENGQPTESILLPMAYVDGSDNAKPITNTGKNVEYFAFESSLTITVSCNDGVCTGDGKVPNNAYPQDGGNSSMKSIEIYCAE